MSRYSKVDRRIWSDQSFRELSAPPPCGRYLWFYLLCSPKLSAIPGLITAGEAEIAEFLGWSIEGFRKAFREAQSKGMVRADWEARLIWLPNATKYNSPESPNVVKSWRIPWDELPECRIKLEAWQSLKDFTEGLSEGYAKAFHQACPKPSAKAMPNPEPEPEPEQEPKQEPLPRQQNQKPCDDVQTSLLPEQPPSKPKKPPKQQPKMMLVDGVEKVQGTVAWEAYSAAFSRRHGQIPERGQKNNSIIKNLIDEIGLDNAISVCGWYPNHPDALYTRQRHPLNLLLRDAQRVLVDMRATVPMTATRANGHDKTASNPFMKPYLEQRERERQEAESREQQNP